MTLQQMIDLLNSDLEREYSHWHFYINAAANVVGLHREELSEFFTKEAGGEMAHIGQFKRVIIGLGGKPSVEVAQFADSSTDPTDLLMEALEMEDEVVANYVQRMDDAIKLQENGGIDKVHGRYIEIFLEDQILDSRGDADHIREMIK